MLCLNPGKNVIYCKVPVSHSSQGQLDIIFVRNGSVIAWLTQIWYKIQITLKSDHYLKHFFFEKAYIEETTRKNDFGVLLYLWSVTFAMRDLCTE